MEVQLHSNLTTEYSKFNRFKIIYHKNYFEDPMKNHFPYHFD